MHAKRKQHQNFALTHIVFGSCSCRVAKGSQLGQTLSNPKLLFSLV